MGKRGPKSRYTSDIPLKVFQLALLGKIETEIAEIIGIKKSTFSKWKLKYKELVVSLKQGKDAADAKVVNSLYERAKGFTHDDKYYPPDTTAIIFWLKNRQPELWRDVKNVEQINKHEFVLEVRHVEANERLDILRKAIDADIERIDSKTIN